ncbi:hypothetical protein NST38_07800 [Paenibacillus sp. FSL H8-0104]|uniref:hypothetical protein n=1 Tax=Paenibacillus sp. FSL H8-0104 TaxID=2954509 RepID=UPI0030FD6657
MYHNFVLVQKINKHADLKVYFATGQYINWTYETMKSPSKKLNNPMFPITITDQRVTIQEKPKGRETSCYRTTENKIRFIDDYGVPEGFVICVTGPEGYIPKLIKFGPKPNVYKQGFSYENPGIFDFYVNATTREASILIHTTERSLFSMAIDFEKYDGDFNIHRKTNYHDTFDLTIALNAGKFEEVTKKDVQDIMPNILESQSEEIVEVMNELIEHLNIREHSSVPNALKLKISNVFNSVLATTSATVTIVDSYINDGSTGKILKTLIEYFSQ